MTKISADRLLLNDWRRRWFSKTSRSSSHTIFPLFSLPLSSRSPFSGRMCVRTSPRFFPYCKRELKSVFILNIRAASVRCSPAWPHRGKTGLVRRKRVYGQTHKHSRAFCCLCGREWVTIGKFLSLFPHTFLPPFCEAHGDEEYQQKSSKHPSCWPLCPSLMPFLFTSASAVRERHLKERERHGDNNNSSSSIRSIHESNT